VTTRFEWVKFGADLLKWCITNIKVIASLGTILLSSTYGVVTTLENQDKSVDITNMEGQITDLAKMMHVVKIVPLEAKTIVIREGCNKCLKRLNEIQRKYHPE